MARVGKRSGKHGASVRVYVASKFENTKEVQYAQAKLLARGHTITHDWTREDAAGKTGAELEEYLSRCAQADYAGSVTCDVFLAINHPAGKGMFFEMGVAYTIGARILFVYPDRNHMIFSWLPEVEWFETIDEALNALDEAAVP